MRACVCVWAYVCVRAFVEAVAIEDSRKHKEEWRHQSFSLEMFFSGYVTASACIQLHKTIIGSSETKQDRA